MGNTCPPQLSMRKLRHKSEVTHIDVGFGYWSHSAQQEPTGRKAGIKEVMNKSELLRGFPAPLWPTPHAFMHVFMHASVHASKDHFALNHTMRKQESAASPGFMAVTWQSYHGFEVNILEFTLWPQQPWLVWFGTLVPRWPYTCQPTLHSYVTSPGKSSLPIPDHSLRQSIVNVSIMIHSECFPLLWGNAACLTYTHSLA